MKVVATVGDDWVGGSGRGSGDETVDSTCMVLVERAVKFGLVVWVGSD